jgi:hypothetical protein
MPSLQSLQGTFNLVAYEGSAGDPLIMALMIGNPGASPAPEPLPSKVGESALFGGMATQVGNRYYLNTTTAYP